MLQYILDVVFILIEFKTKCTCTIDSKAHVPTGIPGPSGVERPIKRSQYNSIMRYFPSVEIHFVHNVQIIRGSPETLILRGQKL